MDVIIYHNRACATSRDTLALIRNAGVEPHVIDYLTSPPSRAMLVSLLARMGFSARQLLRDKGGLHDDLHLGDPALKDDALIDVMLAHPALINRPIVVTPKGVRLCRPCQLVLDLLPPQQAEFFKEDGERVIDQHGRHVATG